MVNHYKKLAFMQKQSSGFTLLELSIVIVIIGLIVAGISAGQSLVRQAGLRSIINDYNRYLASLNSFYLQYEALPGDMRNARDYWGVSYGNGDGDKSIEISETVSGHGIEGQNTWTHLSAAGVVEGSYTSGAFTDASNPQVLDAYWSLSDHTIALYGRFGNRLLLARSATPTGGVVSSSEAYAIDIKVDEGQADTGIMYATTASTVSGTASTCTSGDWADTSSDYNLDVTDRGCRLIFWLQ